MREEAASSTTYSKMINSSGKLIKRYIYHLKNRSQLTCLIHGHGHSSDEFKVKAGLPKTAGRILESVKYL